MIFLRSMRWPRAALATVVFGSTLLGGIAYADGVLHIPGVDRIIHGCFTTDQGKLRLRRFDVEIENGDVFIVM